MVAAHTAAFDAAAEIPFYASPVSSGPRPRKPPVYASRGADICGTLFYGRSEFRPSSMLLLEGPLVTPSAEKLPAAVTRHIRLHAFIFNPLRYF